jgi:hypothetical protein
VTFLASSEFGLPNPIMENEGADEQMMLYVLIFVLMFFALPLETYCDRSWTDKLSLAPDVKMRRQASWFLVNEETKLLRGIKW